MNEYTPNYVCDLHTHTKLSDGNDTYTEIIEKASKLGMQVIAIVDHDILPPSTISDGEVELSVIDYGRTKGIHVLAGIEISCDTNVDDVHIIGLGCDFSSPSLLNFATSMVDSKISSYKKLSQVLCENGINVPWSNILENNGSPLTDGQVQRKHIFEAIARTGYVEDWSVAKLLVRDNPEFNVKREKINGNEAIKLIHDAGGIAILAHPYLIDENVSISGEPATRDEYIENLITHGLDGIEAAYTYNKTSYKGSLTPDEIEKIVIEKYSTRLKVISGGSDYHNDMKKGMSKEKARQIGEKGISLMYFKSNEYLNNLIK